MYTLITFATHWGSKFGGINSFNTDFLEAFGNAYYRHVHVVCIVAAASAEEIEKARNNHVTLLPLPYPPQEKTFTKDQAQTSIELLKQNHIASDPEYTIWLGHDRITGAAAIEAAKLVGGRSALIHHMSYDHYESFAENSHVAYAKAQEQRKLFEQADLVLAVGPLLRDAAQDMIGEGSPVHMLVPGLAEIDARFTPKTYSAFMSGRLDSNAARIKQGHLGIAAFAHAHKKACADKMPDGLCKQPKLMLRGVDFAAEVTAAPNESNPETELRLFAEGYAGRAINLQALPYTENRQELYENLRGASVAMMPSWHEGFGLVAWEAIAAGVPLIISKQSGVYRLLEEQFPGNGTGCVHPIDVHGSSEEPFFLPIDLDAVAEAIKVIAHQPEKSRQMAGTLRNLLLERYTWATCAADMAKIFGWELQVGFPVVPKIRTSIADTPESQPTPNELPVHMPVCRLESEGILSDSQLLRAEEALVPFDSARQPDLEMLNSWLDATEHPIALRLLTGAGGLGKTRLALELCRQHNAAGWHAGFLDGELGTKQLTASWKALQALGQSLLVVIDYAETRQDALLALVKVMLQRRANYPVRVLLLARDGGEWWDNLPGKDRDCEALLSGYATSGPYYLPPLHEATQDRHAAYREALQAFAHTLGVPAPDTIPELEGEHFSRPLYLHMAALLALRGERPATAQGLTRALLNHERRYWHGLFSNQNFDEPEHHAEQLLALTTLAGGFATDKAAWPHWQRVHKEALSASQFKQLFYALIPLYPGKQGLEAVRPDLLGEALVAQTLLRPYAREVLGAALGKETSREMRLHALTVFARLSEHYEELHEVLIESLVRHFVHCWREFIHVATETPSSLPALAEAAFAKLQPNVRNQLVGLLEDNAHEESVQLANFYCLVNESLAEKARLKYQKKTYALGMQHDFAAKLGNFANALGRAGRDKESMDVTQEVLEILQHLARYKSARFDPDYATSLDNYASHLSKVGRDDEALEHAWQALGLRKRLAEKNHDRFDSDYAGSLNNYASRLSDVGRDKEALEYALQALELNKHLAERNHNLFDPDYAGSLNNYANRLSDAGRNEEALEHARQALELNKHLAEKNHDRFDPVYAGSLSNYANRLSDVGRCNEALEHAVQALELRKRLAEKNHDRFDPDYAGSLSNYANHLSDVGRDTVALEHARQALEIYERLAIKNAARYAEDQYSTACAFHCMEWRANASALSELPSIPKTTPTHRRQLLQLYASFARACSSTDTFSRADAFKQVTQVWKDLSVASMTSAVDYWLCATAWCAAHEPASVANLDWQAEWQKFRSQRQNNIPAWMLEVSRRLDFKWPE